MAEKCIFPGCEKPMLALGAGEPMCEKHWEDYTEEHSEYCPGAAWLRKVLFITSRYCAQWGVSETPGNLFEGEIDEKHYSYQELVNAVEALSKCVNHEDLSATDTKELVKAISGEGVTPWHPISEIKNLAPDTMVILKYQGIRKFTLYTVSCGTCREVLGSYERFMEMPECPPIPSQFPIEFYS